MDGGMIGAAVAIALAILGGVGTYFTYKARVDALTAKLAELRADHRVEIDAADKRATDADSRTRDLEVRVEREFVKKNDLAAVEDRLSRRLDQMSNDLKGAITQIIPALGALRARHQVPGRPE